MTKREFTFEGTITLPRPLEVTLLWAQLIEQRVRLLVDDGFCVLGPNVRPRERSTARTDLFHCDFARGEPQAIAILYKDHSSLIMKLAFAGNRKGYIRSLTISMIPIVTAESDSPGYEQLRTHVFTSTEIDRLNTELHQLDAPTLL
jgi:hypothetical protein